MNYNNIDLTNKKAIFVDCDDTLAATMDSHNKAYELAFALNGVPFDIEEHKKWAPLGGDILVKETIIDKGYAHLVDNIIKDKQSLLSICLKKFMRPNKELISFIKNRPDDILTYVVSNGRKNSISEVVDNLGLTFHIDGLVTKEAVSKSKPHPDPYIYALNLTKLNPEDVIVFEDNDIGIMAAQAAGITDIIKVDTDKF